MKKYLLLFVFYIFSLSSLMAQCLIDNNSVTCNIENYQVRFDTNTKEALWINNPDDINAQVIKIDIILDEIKWWDPQYLAQILNSSQFELRKDDSGVFSLKIINGLNAIKAKGFQLSPDINDELSGQRCLYGCNEKQSILDANQENGINASLLEFVINYPRSNTVRGDEKDRNYNNYAPNRVEGLTFDTLVLSRSGGFDFLESWRKTGYSSHAFVSIEGQLIFYINPLKHKGQMAGSWNGRSLEVLVQTDEHHNINQQSIEALRFFKNWFNGIDHLNQIAYCLSHGEARGSEEEGTIANINEVREFLELDRQVPGEKIHTQAELDA